MPGHPLPLAAAAVLALGAVVLPGVASEAWVTRHPDGAAATVNAPTAPAAAAPSQTTPPARAAPSPPASTAGPPRAAAPGHGWRWPLAPAPRVLRGFDVGPFRWSPGHRGVDLGPAAVSTTTTVLAAGPGVVRFAGVVAGRGVVSIDHGSGIRTTYEPVTAVVRAGAAVSAGQALGTLAEGGHCPAAPCLHWGAIVSDRYVDPLTLLRPREPPVLLAVPRGRVSFHEN